MDLMIQIPTGEKTYTVKIFSQTFPFWRCSCSAWARTRTLTLSFLPLLEIVSAFFSPLWEEEIIT